MLLYNGTIELLLSYGDVHDIIVITITIVLCICENSPNIN